MVRSVFRTVAFVALCATLFAHDYRRPPTFGPLLGAMAQTTPAPDYTSLLTKRTLRCDKVWGNISAENKIEDCVTDTDHWVELLTDGEHGPSLVLVLLPLLIAALMFVIFPFIVLFRHACGCFGGAEQRPDSLCCGSAAMDRLPAKDRETMYSYAEIRNVKIAVCVVCLLALVPAVLSLNGTSEVLNDYSKGFDEATNGIVGFLDRKELQLRLLLTDNVTKAFVAPITTAFFTEFTAQTAQVRDSVQSSKDTVGPILDATSIATVVISIAPISLLVLSVIFAVCDCRRLFPLLNAWLHWFIVLLYGLLASGFFAFAFLSRDMCNERDLWTADSNTPGVFSYYSVPKCESYKYFNASMTEIDTLETFQRNKGCTNLADTSKCTTATTYTPGAGNTLGVAFRCPAATPCSTNDQLTARVNQIRVVANGPWECRPSGGTTARAATDCTLARCVTECQPSTTFCAQSGVDCAALNVTAANGQAKARELLDPAGFAHNAVYAKSIINDELQSCKELLRQMVNPITVCDSVNENCRIAGGGLFVYVCLFCAGIVLLLLGQKRFFKRKFIKELDAPPKEGDEYRDDEDPADSLGDEYEDEFGEFTPEARDQRV